MKNIILIVSVFAISMAFLEASVVIYLRELFYPEGFTFPLKSMPDYLILTEFIREAATILMIVTAAWLCSASRHMRFAWFLYIFAVWDIFYYVFLKMILNWPESFFAWDVLFLIPFVWVGPVLAPVLLSLQMIGVWLIFLYFDSGKILKVHLIDYLVMAFGAVIHVINFCRDNALYILQSHNETMDILNLNYIPRSFNWWLFCIASIFIAWSMYRIGLKSLKTTRLLKMGQLF